MDLGRSFPRRACAKDDWRTRFDSGLVWRRLKLHRVAAICAESISWKKGSLEQRRCVEPIWFRSETIGMRGTEPCCLARSERTLLATCLVPIRPRSSESCRGHRYDAHFGLA